MNKVIVIVVVIVSVWLMAIYPHTMLNPGELVKGHQDIQYKCKSCHEPFWGISTEKCISCHKLAEIDKDTTREGAAIHFHKGLKNQECTACHSDHKGIRPGDAITRIDHDMLAAEDLKQCNVCHEKPANKLHQLLSNSCVNCHTTKSWKTPGPFDHSKLQGPEKELCLSCHEKPGDSFHVSLKDNCGKCHGTEKWKPSTFVHSSYYQLDKDHNVACNICHLNNNFKTYTCYGCHEHSESKLREEHEEEGIRDFRDCLKCHKSGSKHDINKEKESNESGDDD